MRNILSLIVMVLTVLAYPAAAADKPTIKIGVTAPLTGDNAHLGESMRDAMILAKESLPGDTKYDYELVFEDDGLEAKRTAAATNKMISVDKIDAIASISSGTGGVVSPIAEQNKVIHFGIASAQSVADGTFNFIHWTTPTEEARVMVQELQNRNVERLAIIEANHPAFIAMRDSLVKGLAGTSVKVVDDAMANPGEKDFRSIIAKSKAANPEIYMLLFFSPELEIVAKQVREAGITQPMTSIEGFGLSSEPALYEGQWYVDAGDAAKGFYTQFEQRFDKAPALGAPNAYDIFNIIVEGFETATAPSDTKPSPENAVEALHQINMDGMMGNITIDNKGLVFSPASVKIIKGGKSVMVDAANAAAPADIEPAGSE